MMFCYLMLMRMITIMTVRMAEVQMRGTAYSEEGKPAPQISESQKIELSPP